MTKRLHAKSSRKGRKEARLRSERAQQHGLPNAPIELPVSRRMEAQQLRESSTDFDPEPGDASSSPRPAAATGPGSRRQWLSSWPWSVKLLSIATVGLIAVGLIRVLGERVESPPVKAEALGVSESTPPAQTPLVAPTPSSDGTLERAVVDVPARPEPAAASGTPEPPPSPAPDGNRNRLSRSKGVASAPVTSAQPAQNAVLPSNAPPTASARPAAVLATPVGSGVATPAKEPGPPAAAPSSGTVKATGSPPTTVRSAPDENPY